MKSYRKLQDELVQANQEFKQVMEILKTASAAQDDLEDLYVSLLLEQSKMIGLLIKRLAAKVKETERN